jgi:hypothetical protein
MTYAAGRAPADDVLLGERMARLAARSGFDVVNQAGLPPVSC